MRPQGPAAITRMLSFANHRLLCGALASTLVTLLRITAPVATLAAAVSSSPAVPYAAQDGNEPDPSIKPGNDFYQYANAVWLRTAVIPAGQSSYSTRALLDEKTSQRVQGLIQDTASNHFAKGSVADEMATISAITNRVSLSAYLGTTLSGEVDGLTASADHIFGLWVNQGFDDADHNFGHLSQGGLGLPSRDAYLDPSPRMTGIFRYVTIHLRYGWPDFLKHF